MAPSSPPPPEPLALSCAGLTLERDGRVFARLPQIALQRRQSAALIGPSGSGKTTAILALTGIRPPHSGTVSVNGTDVWALAGAARDRFRGRQIGLVFQSFHLIDALSVVDNLRLAASSAGLAPDPAHIEHLLERLDLAALRERQTHRLSTGQAQRVAVARALVNRPALVIADEPTSALDDENAAALITLLQERAEEEGAALLIATHDRRVLERTATTIVMERAP